MSTIYLKSAYGNPSPGMREAAARGDVVIVEQDELSPELLLAQKGLITGNQLDQDAMAKLKPALAAFLAAGGRWFFNGHVVRPLIDGLLPYRPIAGPKRADFELTALEAHPLFAGIDLAQIETNKGVAGFYGRGTNPPPPGAVAVNGLGPDAVPVDWVWALPAGGRFFSHAGNDLGQMGQEWELAPKLSARILEWTNGGPCLEIGLSAQALPAWPAQVQPEKSARRQGPRLVAPSSGTYYHTESLEGRRYAETFDLVTTPEALSEVLLPDDVLFVPCRTPAQRMIAQKDVVARHLAAGGTVVATGESRSDLWLPNIAFTETTTNWWWWLTPGADLGVTVTAPGHPLMAGLGKDDVSWHLHGWFTPPDGAKALATDGEGRAILYIDDISTPGRMIVSSLDPMFHHGSHFMPATTRFLDRFLPNLKAFFDARLLDE